MESKKMLKTKSILVLKELDDGKRISIMSRHTLKNGIISHPKIDSSSYDLWMPQLAPPIKLIGDYYKRGLSWERFEQRYLEYIKQPNIQIKVQNLAKESLDSIITLLCIEDSPEHCHRRLLAEECKRYEPDLILSLK